jgi:protein-S-isoprenylcysteine O-methyltransferase Ste14
MVALFLFRRRSRAISTRPLDWVVGVGGSFLPLFLRTTERLGPLSTVGEPLQMIGLLIAVTGTAWLGRSLGLVAADRGLKATGPYALVRHPLYAGYLLCEAGYVLSFPSPRNVVIVAIAVACFFIRAVVEERFLARDPAYREYMRRVPWRFVPFVY